MNDFNDHAQFRDSVRSRVRSLIILGWLLTGGFTLIGLAVCGGALWLGLIADDSILHHVVNTMR
jgi:hypothetical protein